VAAILTAFVIFRWIANTHTHSRANPKPKIHGWGIRNKPAFAALCLVDIVDSMTRTAFLTFIAFLLIAKGVPDGWAALAVPLVLVGGMAGKYLCGVLADKYGVIRTIVITELATGAGILATLEERISGRWAASPVVHPETGEVLVDLVTALCSDMPSNTVKYTLLTEQDTSLDPKIEQGLADARVQVGQVLG